MLAVQQNNPELVTSFIKNGAGVDKADNFGITALMLAAKTNPTPKIIEILIKFGAQVNRLRLC